MAQCKILLNTGDFLLLNTGDNILLNDDSCTEGGGSGGVATSKGARSLAQQQLIPKRRRILETHLALTGNTVIPLKLDPFTTPRSKPEKKSLHLYSNLIKQCSSRFELSAAPVIFMGIRWEVDGKILFPLTNHLIVKGLRKYPKEMQTDILIGVLKQQAQEKFYE